MNPVLISAIRELKVERGIQLDPLIDLVHIFRLKVLADAVLDVQKDLQSEAVLRPTVRVGSATFRRLSIGSIAFLNSKVATWFKPDSNLTVLSYAYCHAHGDRPDLIWGYDRKDDWAHTVEAWSRSLGVSWAELVAAMKSFQAGVSELDPILEQILGPPRVDDEKPKSESFGPLIDLLSSQYSFDCPPSMTPSEYWLWRVPQDEVEGLVDACLNRIEMEETRKRKPGSVASDPDRTYIKAHFALQKYLDMIVAEKKGAPDVK